MTHHLSVGNGVLDLTLYIRLPVTVRFIAQKTIIPGELSLLQKHLNPALTEFRSLKFIQNSGNGLNREENQQKIGTWIRFKWYLIIES